MGTSAWHLHQKKQRLVREINTNLDFLSGSVTSQGPRGGFSLTFKEAGKTRSKYIRSSMLGDARKMVERNKKLKVLLSELSTVNWEILKAENAPNS